MAFILVPEAAEFPKLFCDLTPKVSNVAGTMWENYSLQRIFNKFKFSSFKDCFSYSAKTINDPWGVLFKAFLYHAETNGYSFSQK